MDEKAVSDFIKKLEKSNYNAFLVYKFYQSGVVEEMESIENVLRFLTNFYIENNQRIVDYKEYKKNKPVEANSKKKLSKVEYDRRRA